MSEIKACPFCGGAKICTEKGININYCDNCSAESNIEQWNTRPIEDALNARIAELEAAQRWIPVSERLPETYKPVLTVDMSEATQVPVPAFYNPDTECWSTHFKYDLWVTHWMPLPESPIVYGKVCEE